MSRKEFRDAHLNNAFEIMNHPTEKIELIIGGGVFLEYPERFQYEFVKGHYDVLN